MNNYNNELKEKISQLIYNKLEYAYCDNCRGPEAENYEEEEKYCGNCHRKYQNWGIGKNIADELAEQIFEYINK